MCSISERTCSIPIALLQFSLDCSGETFGAAPEIVVKTKPPEQDLDFTNSFHGTDIRTNHERIGKPLGIGGLTAWGPQFRRNLVVTAASHARPLAARTQNFEPP